MQYSDGLVCIKVRLRWNKTLGRQHMLTFCPDVQLTAALKLDKAADDKYFRAISHGTQPIPNCDESISPSWHSRCLAGYGQTCRLRWFVMTLMTYGDLLARERANKQQPT